MSNLTGENLPDYVARQIQQRQLLAGQGFNSNKKFKSEKYNSYFNSNNCFLNVVSCIDLNSTKLRDKANKAKVDYIFTGFEGSELAKSFILRGGVSKFDQSGSGKGTGGSITPNSLRRGIRTDPGKGFTQGNNAYGLGNIEKYGQNPMPTVESFSIKSKNRGSLREATIKIKAYTTDSFKLIDALYMRLGYSIFVEWGNAFILPNNDAPLILNNISLADKILNEEFKNQDILFELEKKRIESKGNYDGFLGKIKNYDFSMDSAGHWDINLSVISQGDVIESLKINTNELAQTNLSSSEKEDLAEFKSEQKERETEAAEEGYVASDTAEQEVAIWAKRGKSDINWLLYKLSTLKGGDKAWFSDTRYADSWRASEEAGGARQPPVVINSSGYYSIPSVTRGFRNRETADVVFLDFEDVGSTINNYYIRLGFFLEFLEQTCMLYETDDSGNIRKENRVCSDGVVRKLKKPIVRISYNPNSNFCFSTPFHISADPRVCVLSKWVKLGSGAGNEFTKAIGLPSNSSGTFGGQWKKLYPNLDQFDDPLKVQPEGVGDNATETTETTQAYHGKIMNVYLSFSEILRQLDSATTKTEGDESETNLYDFLNNILRSITKATGNINDFQIVHDADTNFLKIIDTTKIKGFDKISRELKRVLGEKIPIESKFAIKNLIVDGESNLPQSPIIKDYSIKSEISSKLATQITIGAQDSEGNQGKSMGLANLNYGFTNRLVQNVVRSNGKENTAESAEERFASNLSNINTFLESQIDTEGSTWYSWLWDDDSYWDESVYDATVPILNSFLTYAIAQESKKTGTDNPQIGFLPINLSLTIPGLSGIKIYNKFQIDSNFLPQNYGSSLSFLIKGISHELKDDMWITTIESLSVPSDTADGKKIIPTQILSLGRKNIETPNGIKSKSQVGGTGPPVKLNQGVGDGITTSITSGITLTRVKDGVEYQLNLIERGNSPIKRIWLHHTAGWDKRKGTISGWTTRESSGALGKVHTPFIIGRTLPEGFSGLDTSYTGLVEQVYDELKYTGWASSTGTAGDVSTVNIELAGLGYIEGGPRKNKSVANKKGLDPDTDLYYSWAARTKDGQGIYIEDEIAKPVDKDLKEIPSWQGHEFWVKYPQNQIDALEQLLISLIQKYDGNGKNGIDKKHNVIPEDGVMFTWDQMFGPKISGKIIRSKAGFWGHRKSVNKSDIWPQKELVEMLQNVQAKAKGAFVPTANSLPITPPPASNKEIKLGLRIWKELQTVLIQEDVFGIKGTPLLQDKSKSEVLQLISNFIRYRPYNKPRDQGLSPTDDKFFKWGSDLKGKVIPNSSNFSSLKLPNTRIQNPNIGVEGEPPLITIYSNSKEKFNNEFQNILNAIRKDENSYVVDWYQAEGLGQDVALSLPIFD
jgi:hypothetical protein